MTQPTFIDLCAGAGLFSAGFVSAGMKPTLAIDVDPCAVATYRRNVADCAEVRSIANLSGVPRANVLIAGPPCQGFSTLGRQDPLDVRNELSSWIPLWAEKSGADIVVIENVPPFLNSTHWESLAESLVRAKYEISTWILDAVDYGAPQLRKRAFTIASRLGAPAHPKVLRRRPTVADVLSRPISPDDPMHTWPVPSGVAAKRIALVPAGGDKRDIMRVAPELCPPSWAKVGCQATDVWGRIRADRPANTIRCTFQNPSKGRYLHPSEDRVLSLREAARIQGVPDSWIFVGRPYPVARQIGNGVPIPLAKAVAKSVAATISASQEAVKIATAA